MKQKPRQKFRQMFMELKIIIIGKIIYMGIEFEFGFKSLGYLMHYDY